MLPPEKSIDRRTVTAGG